MKRTLTPHFVAIAVLIGLVYGLVSLYTPYNVQGAAPGGLTATVATTSNPTVGTTASLVFASSSPLCAARVISTGAQPITITFSDNQGKVPTGSFGTYQAASTTVTYDGGLFGCNAVRIYSFATQLITVVETQ